MRQHKFRGKHVHALFFNQHLQGIWVYGYLAAENYISSPEFPDKLVDPETVGESTGLTDKKGKEIFEGDICYDPVEKIYGEIEYIEEQAVYVFNDGHILTELAVVNEFIEIKGNRIDNPEYAEIIQNQWSSAKDEV